MYTIIQSSEAIVIIWKSHQQKVHVQQWSILVLHSTMFTSTTVSAVVVGSVTGSPDTGSARGLDQTQQGCSCKVLDAHIMSCFCFIA